MSKINRIEDVLINDGIAIVWPPDSAGRYMVIEGIFKGFLYMYDKTTGDGDMTITLNDTNEQTMNILSGDYIGETKHSSVLDVILSEEEQGDVMIFVYSTEAH